MRTSGFAPAKVNLFLHVGPVDVEGYHPLASLMSFADVGDRLTLSPAKSFSFGLDGDFAAALAGEDPAGNLVWRAALRLLERAGASAPPLKLTLTKALPVAAGLGGGSSDAGAALKLLRDALDLPVDDAGLEVIAAELGADGPACLAATPLMAKGRGEQLSAPPTMPLLPTVLVNPRVACSTGRVYRTFDEQGAVGGADAPDLAARYDTVEAVIELLAACRNDLEAPAIAVAPQIQGVLSLLRDQAQTLLARLSGSGATAFALCATDARAAELAAEISALRPDWWVRACRLGGPWPAG
ncbi:MAG: 4-(cytidine 5'-diphospho)-2-C-methyl-D-erythritol kinase [Caulobacteraceae bacterium]